MNQKVGIIGIIGALILVVAISGCTSSSTNSTFTDGKMSFNYPSDFQNATNTSDIISGGESWQTVANLANSDGVDISVQKSSLSGITPDTIVAATEAGIKNNNGSVLSTTSQTNPNGVKISGSITTLTDPTTNNLLKYYDMSFTANGQVYGVTVYGKDSDNTKILEIKNTVFNSIKVS